MIDSSSPTFIGQILETSEVGSGNFSDIDVKRQPSKVINNLSINPVVQKTLTNITQQEEKPPKSDESYFMNEPRTQKIKLRCEALLDQTNHQFSLNLNYQLEEFNPKKYLFFSNSESYFGLQGNSITAGSNFSRNFQILGKPQFVTQGIQYKTNIGYRAILNGHLRQLDPRQAELRYKIGADCSLTENLKVKTS